MAPYVITFKEDSATGSGNECGSVFSHSLIQCDVATGMQMNKLHGKVTQSHSVVIHSMTRRGSRSHRKGGRDSRVFEKLLTRPKMLPLLFQFIARSGRFRTVFGDLPDVTLPENSARRAWKFRDVYTVEAYEVATFTSVA
ncbi:hypothetical protein B0H13DRAFT_1918762 [Mycena leptocephala]|nr:hypothetical protein B0H13DRAFT_1918762 [Mycena leptocephala]